MVVARRWLHVIKYISANYMTFAAYPYGKNRLHFQHLGILALIHNMLPPPVQKICLSDRFQELNCISHIHLPVHQNKKLPNYFSAVQPSTKPTREARSYNDAVTAVELWLSVP
jgi:ABC-type thiamine transport system substrate-binding protein